MSPDETIDALYVFSDCEISYSPNPCVIIDNKPHFLSVKEMLRRSADSTLNYLRMELEIRLGELEDEWHKTSLEKIFILNKVYLVIEESKTEAEMYTRMDEGLKPFVKHLRKPVTQDDLVRLANIPVKRISRYSSFEADNYLKNIEAEMVTINGHIANIVQFAIDYFQHIKDKYGKDKQRRTELRNFEVIDATEVAIANTKLYGNLADGFIGSSLKKDQFLFDCSDIDDIIVFQENGKYVISKVSDKAFFGKNIIHVAVFRKNDERTIYNAIYADGATGIAYMKRFTVTNITRDREYDVTQGSPRSKLLYFTVNPNGEAEKIRIWLKPRPKLKKTIFDVDFGLLSIKGRQSMGNVVSKNPIHKVKKTEDGFSTLGGIKIWYDTTTQRLNQSERGQFVGEFKGAEKILVIAKSGKYITIGFDISYHFDEIPFVTADEHSLVEKFKAGKTVSLVYFDGEQKYFYLKRFALEESDKWRDLIGDHKDSYLHSVSLDKYPRLEITYPQNSKHSNEIIDADEFIAVKGHTAKGKRLTTHEFEKVVFVEPVKPDDELEDNDQEQGQQFDVDEAEIFKTPGEAEQPELF